MACISWQQVITIIIVSWGVWNPASVWIGLRSNNPKVIGVCLQHMIIVNSTEVTACDSPEESQSILVLMQCFGRSHPWLLSIEIFFTVFKCSVLLSKKVQQNGCPSLSLNHVCCHFTSHVFCIGWSAWRVWLGMLSKLKRCSMFAQQSRDKPINSEKSRSVPFAKSSTFSVKYLRTRDCTHSWSFWPILSKTWAFAFHFRKHDICDLTTPTAKITSLKQSADEQMLISKVLDRLGLRNDPTAEKTW